MSFAFTGIKDALPCYPTLQVQIILEKPLWIYNNLNEIETLTAYISTQLSLSTCIFHDHHY